MPILSKLIDKALMKEWFLPYKCHEVIHTWDPSCTSSAISLGWTVFTRALRMYTGLYLASQLLLERKFTRSTTRKTIESIIQSSSFLAFAVFSSLTFVCVLTKALGKFYYMAYVLTPAFFGNYLAIFLERQNRRGMLAFYCANIASECLYNIFLSRGYVRPLPYGETLLFSLTMGVLCYGIRKYRFDNDILSYVLKQIVDPELRTAEEIASRVYFIDVGDRLPVLSVCPHAGRCTSYAVHGFMKSFIVGWIGSAVVSALFKWENLFQRGKSMEFSLRDSANINFGFFLGLFSLLFKATNCVQRHIKGESRSEHLLVSGMLAGTAMVINRSSTLSAYVFWKFGETFYNQLVNENMIPHPPLVTALIYAVSTNILFYAMNFEPWSIADAYQQFLNNMSNHKLEQLNNGVLQILGGGNFEGKPQVTLPSLDPRYCSRRYIETFMLWIL